MCPGFSHFSSFLHYFVLVKLATTSMKVKTATAIRISRVFFVFFGLRWNEMWLEQGPTLTFEGTCPFGQSVPKICLPEKKFNLPPKMLFCTLFIINTVTSYFGCLFSIFYENKLYRGIQFRMTISLWRALFCGNKNDNLGLTFVWGIKMGILTCLFGLLD